MSGPSVAHRRGFTAELRRQGCSPFAVVAVLYLTAHLSRWLERQGLDARDLSAECVERYLAARRASGQVRRLTPLGLRPLLSYLHGLGGRSAAGGAGGADGCNSALAVARCVHRLSASAPRSRAADRRRLACSSTGSLSCGMPSMRRRAGEFASERPNRSRVVGAVTLPEGMDLAPGRRRGPSCLHGATPSSAGAAYGMCRSRVSVRPWSRQACRHCRR